MGSGYGDSKLNAKSPMSNLTSSLFSSPFELCDVVSTVFFCKADETMMLVVEPTTNEYWIPSVKATERSSWLSFVRKDLGQDIFGATLPTDKLMRYVKVWLPATVKPGYISHSIFNIQVNMAVKKKSKSISAKFKGKICWSSFDEVMNYHTNNLLKSPEIVDLMCWNLNRKSTIANIPSEHMMVGNFMEINDTILITARNTIYEQIVHASGLSRAAQEILYTQFLIVCFPCVYMSLQNFSKFMIGLRWGKDDIPHLFRSADLYDRGGLSFREFIYFLAATEQGTSHGGGNAELRCRYIFRYLDTSNEHVLKRNQLKNFIRLIRKARKQPLTEDGIEKELKECYQSIGVAENHALTISEFLRAVGELKVRGTSLICRAPTSIKIFVKEISDMYPREKGTYGSKTSALQMSTQSPAYQLALHSVKIQSSAAAIKIQQFWNIDNATSAVNVSAIPFNEILRKESMHMFDQHSESNELLKAIRYLMQVNGKKNEAYIRIDTMNFEWGQLNPHVVFQNLFTVCSVVKEILKTEPRLVDVSAPVYIMGDLHGNFADLLFFEKMFWPVGPALCPCNLLFLGDYVDRGVYSFEVACYLLCYKLQSPRKVFLLRGNHEIRRVQAQWTFEKECKLKFGEKLGSLVHNVINDVFDVLPLAAVIDDSVFCCHGGIPPPWLCPVTSAIKDIPIVLPEPQDQSYLAWELMWNDPVRTKHITEKVMIELQANEGFAMNSRRGTAHIFSVEALEKFLAVNRYTHLVRAHEVVEAGFYLQQKGHMVTVFSSSKYCGGTNMAACIFADQGKLRVMRVELESTTT